MLSETGEGIPDADPSVRELKSDTQLEVNGALNHCPQKQGGEVELE